MSGFFGIMHQSIRGRQIVDIGRSLLQKDDRCKKQLSCHTTHSSWGQRTVADLSRTSAFAYLLVHVSWQWKESKRNIWPRPTKYFMLPRLFNLPEEPSAVPTEPWWAPEFPHLSICIDFKALLQVSLVYLTYAYWIQQTFMIMKHFLLNHR